MLDALRGLCNHDTHAIALIEEMWHLATVWDDAVDGDKHQPPYDVHRAFEWALFGVHSNPLMLDHPELRAVLQLCVINWKCANELEQRGTPDAVATAYGLRCSPYDFFVAVIGLAAGPEAAYKAARLLRGAPDADSFARYCQEHLKA